MNFTGIGDKRSLPARVVETVTAAILAGDWREGDALPTEPELATQFGVSRSVIRDAVRMLVAKGLVEIRRGKGTFVASAQGAAFAEAMVLTLGRRGATAWDIEEAFGVLLPEFIALAAERAEDADLQAVRAAGEAYLSAFGEELATGGDGGDARLKALFAAMMRRIFEATRNHALILLGETLVGLKEFRHFEDAELDAAGRARLAEAEARAIRGLIEAVCERNPDRAREKVRSFRLSPSALKRRLEETPVGVRPEVSLEMFGFGAQR